VRVAVLALLLALGACSKDEGPPRSARPEQIGATERQRGSDACTAYVERLCACSAKKPDDKDLADRCHLKHAKIEALDLALMVDDDPNASPQNVFQAQDQARKIIARCIDENVQLDAECP
jgi:hypothetical protein